ncbi:MAG: 2-phospho-L-lactate transferase [Ktedonobacterales bacterium]
MIVALAGGVGGAKLADGLYRTLGSGELSVVVNTADDFELFGLRISPDFDTVLYTLAGIANPETGWGIAGDTFDTLAMLKRYGEDTWFWLGDRDLATHILRSQRLRAGETPTRVAAALARALGVEAALLPMSDQPVATRVRTPDGELAFQDYFVRRRHEDDVLGVRFDGIAQARVTPEVRAALVAAQAVVFCPSNPIVSIGPLLAVPGMRALLAETPAPKVAVSPIIGGRALKGPADRMLATLGHGASPVAVAELYRDLLAGMVIDRVDAALAGRVEALGIRVLVTNTIMTDSAGRERLAREVLAFAAELAPGSHPYTEKER